MNRQTFGGKKNDKTLDILVLLIFLAIVVLMGIYIYMDFRKGVEECIRVYGNCSALNGG